MLGMKREESVESDNEREEARGRERKREKAKREKTRENERKREKVRESEESIVTMRQNNTIGKAIFFIHLFLTIITQYRYCGWQWTPSALKDSWDGIRD